MPVPCRSTARFDPAQVKLYAAKACETHGVLTVFGAIAVTFMMLMHALERRGRRLILAVACRCLLSSAYGFLAGTWPFGVGGWLTALS